MATNKILGTIIDLILVFGALIVLFTIYSALMGVFGSSVEKDQASIHNMEELKRQVTRMEESDKYQMPIYIKNDFFLVAFSHAKFMPDPAFADSGSCKTTFGLNKINIKKPEECNNFACICICKRKDPCQSGSKCVRLSEQYKFESDVCGTAMVNGKSEPQSIIIKRSKDTVKICLEDC